MAYTEVTKDKDWLVRLNKNDLSNSITDTGWQSAGIVYTNGFTSNASDPFQYRIIKFGTSGIQHVYVSGIIASSASFKIEKAAAKAIVTFPKVVKDLLDNTVGHNKSLVGRESSSNWGTTIEFTVGSNGIFKVQSRATDTSANELVFVDLILVIGAP